MTRMLIKIIKLFAGLFLYAVGIVITVNANLGLAPWDVFHQGLAEKFSVTMGQAGIAIGFILIIINVFLGERIGWGTVANMIFIGLFVDILMKNSILPIPHGFILSVLSILIGLFIISMGSYLYISSALGSGPRDSLMIALTKLTGKPVGIIRNSIEVVVLISGYILGGMVGLGTILSAFLIGYCVQIVFMFLKFDVKQVKHRFIDEDFNYIKDRLFKNKADTDKLAS